MELYSPYHKSSSRLNINLAKNAMMNMIGNLVVTCTNRALHNLDLFQKYLIWSSSNWAVSKVKGYHAVISNVAQDYHIFKEAKEGLNIGLTVLVMPPVEVKGKGCSRQGYFHKLLLVTNSSPLIPTPCLEPTMRVEVEHCEDHWDHTRAHERNEECFVKLKDVWRWYKAESQKGEIFNNVEAKV